MIWQAVKDGDDRARALFRRHYSYRAYRDGRNPRLFAGPGEKQVLLTTDCRALWVWRKFIDKSGQQGVNCAVFRNESPLYEGAVLVAAAMAWAFIRWPGERLYTYVDAHKIGSPNPGYCFKLAGWRTVRGTDGRPLRTKDRGLHILEYTR